MTITRKTINCVLNDIVDSCISNIEINVDLFNGNAGKLLFLKQYLGYYNHEAARSYFVECLNQVHVPLAESSHIDFQNQASLNWFYNLLYKDEIIDAEDYSRLQKGKILLKKKSMDHMENGNYDFFYGALHTAYFSLFDSEVDYSYIDKILDSISNLQCIQRVTASEIDLGLAHGITSILRFCKKCFDLSISKSKCFNISVNIVEFLISIGNIEDKSCYPYVYNKRNDANFSRLGWCYGDLTIGYTLLDVSNILMDKKLATYAISILKKCATRREETSTLAVDCGICHGSAGIAHIFNRLANVTNLKEFAEASNFWFKQTLRFGKGEDGRFNFKRYDGQCKEFVSDNGLLEGAAGVGLTLLSYLTSDYSWDKCIMLNG